MKERRPILPVSNDVQTVTQLRDELGRFTHGWTATIKCEKQKPSGCNEDYGLTNPGGGINHRRMYAFRRFLGV